VRVRAKTDERFGLCGIMLEDDGSEVPFLLHFEDEDLVARSDGLTDWFALYEIEPLDADSTGERISNRSMGNERLSNVSMGSEEAPAVTEVACAKKKKSKSKGKKKESEVPPTAEYRALLSMVEREKERALRPAKLAPSLSPQDLQLAGISKDFDVKALTEKERCDVTR
jgi:hypothetical protein